MCGRITLTTPAAKLIELFQLTEFPRMEPGYNIAPTHLVACIRLHGTQRQAIRMRWGLIPSWAKDVNIGNRMINARSETAAEKPAFRKAWTSRRCLIPIDGFYEWEKIPGGKKQPWLIHMPDRTPFSLAGLWETWKPTTSEAGDAVLSCTILTTSANTDMSPIHDRMPVIVPPEYHATWLSNEASPGQLNSIAQPLSPGFLQRYPVSTTVNKATVNSAECLAPLPETGGPNSTQLSLFGDDN